MEYRIHITLIGLAESSQDAIEKAGEQVLEGFMQAHPETGPVVSASFTEATVTITYALVATNANEASDLGRPIFVDGMKAAMAEGLDLTDIRAHSIEVEPVPIEEMVKTADDGTPALA